MSTLPGGIKYFVCCNRAFTSKDSFAKHKLEKHSQIITFRNPYANQEAEDLPKPTKINIVPSKSMSISVKTIPGQKQQHTQSPLPKLQAQPKPKRMAPPTQTTEPQPSTSAAAVQAQASYSNQNSPSLQDFYQNGNRDQNPGQNDYQDYPEEDDDDNDDQDFYANAISQCTAVLKEETDEVLNFVDESEKQITVGNPENKDDCTGYGYLIGNMQYRCNSCYKVTSSVAVLKIHYESMHRAVKNTKKCGLCGINVKHRCNFTRHLRTCHVPEGITCPFCTCTFSTQLGLNSHVVKIHTVEDQRAYLNIRPMTKSSFRRMSTTPNAQEGKLSHFVNGNSAGQIKSNEKNKVFLKRNEEMKNNLQQNNGSENHNQDLEEEADEDPNLYGNLKSEIIRTSGGKFYECRLCGKLMKSRINLRQHMLIHSGEKPLGCVLCGIKFRFECNRRRHMRTCHSTTGKFKCMLCSCKFTSPVGLKVHISKYHNSSVPAKNAINRTIAQLAAKAKLNKMLAAGTVNMYNINSNDSARNQVNEINDEVDDNSEEQEVHKCDECGKILNSKLNLRNHKLIHTGEKPEICSLCGQTFRLHSTLWGHMKVSHVKNGAFPCSQCPCVFDTERGAIRHKVIYHNFHSLEYRKRGKRLRSKNKIVFPQMKVKIPGKSDPSVSSSQFQQILMQSNSLDHIQN